MTEVRREKPGAESKVSGRLGGLRARLGGLELDGLGAWWDGAEGRS